MTRMQLRVAGTGVGAVLAALLVLGCTGVDGATGASGAAGAQGGQGPAGGAGPAGSAGPAGMSGVGVDGGALPTSCLSPCHGFGGIVEQWKTSTHYAAFVSNLGGTEVDTWTGAQACGNCHAIDAIQQRVAGNVGTVAGGTVTNLASGELEYRNPTNGSLTESTYAGSAKVAAVNCVTCHSVTDATDPHRTGLAWTPGSFPIRVPNGATDQAYIEKSPTLASVTGTPAGALGTANVCVWCHRSRKDVTSYITASNALSSSHWGPHEGPQADVTSGAGGYHYAGKTYGQSTHNAALVCVDCHMPDVATNSGAPDHSFYAQVRACTQCHLGATNFDMGGGQSQIKASLFELQRALNDAGYLTRASAAPYPALAPSELADGAFDLDQTRPTGGAGGTVPILTADQAGAVYNYIILARGSAFGVHNPKYVRQILFDSFVAIKGTPPLTLVRPQ